MNTVGGFEVSQNEQADQPEQQATEHNQGDGSGDLQKLEERVRDLEAQVKDKESKYVYLYAEFENFKRRAQKERGDLMKYGWESVARDLLQVVDNMARALSHMSPQTDPNLRQGLEMVLQQFQATLAKQGVQPIEAAGQPFDPNFHEAIAQESSDLHPEGTIIQEHSKGFTLHGRLLRPARVIVSSGKN